MKCIHCPAYCQDQISLRGCIALKHQIQDYWGCNRSLEKIEAELKRWDEDTPEYQKQKLVFLNRKK